MKRNRPYRCGTFLYHIYLTKYVDSPIVPGYPMWIPRFSKDGHTVVIGAYPGSRPTAWPAPCIRDHIDVCGGGRLFLMHGRSLDHANSCFAVAQSSHVQARVRGDGRTEGMLSED